MVNSRLPTVTLSRQRRPEVPACLRPRALPPPTTPPTLTHPHPPQPYRNHTVARDWREARTRLGWPWVTRGSHSDGHAQAPLAVGGKKVELKPTFTDLRAMHWQHGQVVQGAPRIQNYQTKPSGASETGLPTLSHRCAQHADRLRSHLPQPGSAGHPRCLQTPKGAGFRGPVHSRWEYLLRLEFERGGLAGYQVRVPETQTDQGGNYRKEQPNSGRRRRGHAGCRCRKREISNFTSVVRPRQQGEGE